MRFLVNISGAGSSTFPRPNIWTGDQCVNVFPLREQTKKRDINIRAINTDSQKDTGPCANTSSTIRFFSQLELKTSRYSLGG